MELKDNIKTFHARSRAAWRNWLKKNHDKESSVWLILYKKESTTPSINYAEAVEEALCFGWIDSKANKRDDNSYFQFFARRNPRSNWSALNKTRVARLIEDGLMTEAGMQMIRLAKETGTWTALEEVDQLKIPPDLELAFNNNKTALQNWELFSKSARRAILEWVHNAKRPETRQKRIEETVTLAEKNIKANQYNPK